MRCKKPPTSPILHKCPKHQTITKGRCLRRVVKLHNRMEAKRTFVGKKKVLCIKVGFSCLALCVWTCIAERRAWTNSSVLYSDEPDDSRDMLMSVQHSKYGERRKYMRRSAVSIFPRQRRCVGQCCCRENTAENEARSAHFCERTVISIRHVACQWRGTSCGYAYIAAGE